jgi:hypothetical protein
VLWKLHISASSNHAARIGFDRAHWVEFDCLDWQTKRLPIQITPLLPLSAQIINLLKKTKLKSRLPIQITPRGSVLTPLIGSNSIERYWCFATQITPLSAWYRLIVLQSQWLNQSHCRIRSPLKLLQIQITATNWYRLAERYWCFATQITPLSA